MGALTGHAGGAARPQQNRMGYYVSVDGISIHPDAKEFSSFDEAYDAAYAAGGDVHVAARQRSGRLVNSEYVQEKS